MSAQKRSALGIVRSPWDGESAWAIVGEAFLEQERGEGVTIADLEKIPVDRQELNEYVARLMAALERHSANRTSTPGGADWLYVQHVPVRRLLSRLVRKLLALQSWRPFADAPGPLRPAPYEGLIGVRETSSREYHAYTVTWSGIAYVLGAATSYNPSRSARLRRRIALSRKQETRESREEHAFPRTGTMAVSWSSRHANTLLPVLEELARLRQPSVLLDLATDPADRCPQPRSSAISIHVVPPTTFAVSGKTSGLWSEHEDSGATVQVGMHMVLLDRLERLAVALVETAGGCTQPSWHGVLRTERWLDEAMEAVRPRTVLLSNDTSPLGALAVHAAERHGAATVHVQHGAWLPESVAWPALHSRHLVVMGERDAALARDWARHPKAQIHVLGQPRFDRLAEFGRLAQRRYLQKVLAAAAPAECKRIAVWACQPFGPERLRHQARSVVAGLAQAAERWGLVIAPHPAQDARILDDLALGNAGVPVGVADARVGARGCLAGADAVMSVSSTCGIEAVLLGVPVIELGLPGEDTLRLAEYGAARNCRSAQDVAVAVNALRDGVGRIPREARDAVCRWRGRSAADIAQLIAPNSPTSLVPSPRRSEPSALRHEGIAAR